MPSGSSTHDGVVVRIGRQLHPDAAHELAADRRVIALDARVDDRDRDPACRRRRRRPTRGPAPERQAAPQVAPGGRRRTARSRPGGASSSLIDPARGVRQPRGPADRTPRRAPRARARPGARARRGAPRRAPAARARPGGARATRSTSGQSGSSGPPTSATAAATSASTPAAGASSPASEPSTTREERRDVALDAAGPDRDRGLAGEDAGQLDVADARRSPRSACRAPRGRRSCRRSSTSGTATMERGTYCVCSAKHARSGGRGRRRRSRAPGPWRRRSRRARGRAGSRGRRRPGPAAPAATRKTRTVAGGVEEGERGGLGLEEETAASTIERRTASRAAQLQPPGDLGAPADRRQRLAGGGDGRLRAAGPLRRRRRSSFGRAFEPLEVRDDEGLLLDPDQPLGREVGEQAVHGLARPADHRRELRLGERPGEADLAVRVRVGLAGHAHDAPREPAGQVEEVELLDVVGQPAQLADEAREAGRAAGRAPSSTRRSKASRRRTRARVGSRAIAVAEWSAPSRRASSPKKSPRSRVAMIAPSSPSGRAARSSPRRFDDVQGVAGVALVEDRLVLPMAAHPQGRGDEIERRLANPPEERALSKRVPGEAGPVGTRLDHRALPWYCRRPRAPLDRIGRIRAKRTPTGTAAACRRQGWRRVCAGRDARP